MPGQIPERADALTAFFRPELTPRSCLRAIARRWPWVFLFLLVGVSVAALLMATLPETYRATATFTMNLRQASNDDAAGRPARTIDSRISYVELYNTCLYGWRSDEMLTTLLKSFRVQYPSATIADEAIVRAFADVKIELRRLSRLIEVSVKAEKPQTCADLVNLYVREIAAQTEADNQRRYEAAVVAAHERVKRQRKAVEDLTKAWVNLRTANSIDGLKTQLDIALSGVRSTAEELASLASEEMRLSASEELMKSVSENPELYGGLSAGDPRAADIAGELKAYQAAEDECRRMLSLYTKRHPGVRLSGKAVLVARKRLQEVVGRALANGQATLREVRARKSEVAAKHEEYETRRRTLESRIAYAEGSGRRLSDELESARRLLSELMLSESQISSAAALENAMVVIGNLAEPPEKPSFPDWRYVYGISLLLALVLGVSLVVILDRNADLVSGIADIEQRLSLRVLAVLPHVSSRGRQNVALMLKDDTQRHSAFAEGVFGLRNLLDSGNFGLVGRRVLVVSTQPGEGKTITATSLAIAIAQTGRRTLLVDFDFRRPQQCGIWNLQLDRSRSFSHALTDSGREVPDFAKLANPTDVAGLDIIASLAPDGVYPADLFGSPAIRSFFAWASVVYDSVVVDAPPFGVVGDVVALASFADSTLLMCRPDRTSGYALYGCATYLNSTGARVLGVVVNDADLSPNSPFAPSAIGGYTLSHTSADPAQQEELDQADRYSDD